MVEAGTTSWDEIVSFGLALPAGDNSTDLFTTKFLERKRNADN